MGLYLRQEDALNAALNPYEEYMAPNEEMLFCVDGSEIGLHAFNSTYEGHFERQAKV